MIRFLCFSEKCASVYFIIIDCVLSCVTIILHLNFILTVSYF